VPRQGPAAKDVPNRVAKRIRDPLSIFDNLSGSWEICPIRGGQLCDTKLLSMTIPWAMTGGKTAAPMLSLKEHIVKEDKERINCLKRKNSKLRG
jgi:hypothetical protein